VKRDSSHSGLTHRPAVHQGFADLLARAENYPGTSLRIANRIWAQNDVEWAPGS
jgi:hypothetical protein